MEDVPETFALSHLSKVAYPFWTCHKFDKCYLTSIQQKTVGNMQVGTIYVQRNNIWGETFERRVRLFLSQTIKNVQKGILQAWMWSVNWFIPKNFINQEGSDIVLSDKNSTWFYWGLEIRKNCTKLSSCIIGTYMWKAKANRFTWWVDLAQMNLTKICCHLAISLGKWI